MSQKIGQQSQDLQTFATGALIADYEELDDSILNNKSYDSEEFFASKSISEVLQNTGNSSTKPDVKLSDVFKNSIYALPNAFISGDYYIVILIAKAFLGSPERPILLAASSFFTAYFSAI